MITDLDVFILNPLVCVCALSKCSEKEYFKATVLNPLDYYFCVDSPIKIQVLNSIFFIGMTASMHLSWSGVLSE